MTTDLERKPSQGSRAPSGKSPGEGGEAAPGKTPSKAPAKAPPPKRATARTQAQDAPAANESDQAREAQPRPGAMPLWERSVGAIGLVLVLAVLGLLVYDGVQPAAPPALTLALAAVAAQPGGGYLVEVAATNTGAATAAGVTVEGTLTDPADPTGSPVETAEFTLDYVPNHSTRRGGLFFTRDPGQYELGLRALGYNEP